jgi:RNA polymerase subunit RPABC4/transcription elongation factor Spt4
MPRCKICNEHTAFYNLEDEVCTKCLFENITIEEKELQKVIIKNYKGSQEKATRSFKNDSLKMSKKGYYPTSQNWNQGSWGCGSFILALLLCIIIIGVLVFIYMLIVKPDGTLSVTYELKKEYNESVKNKAKNLKEKECPQCAEIVKEKAKICRFCRHDFINLSRI